MCWPSYGDVKTRDVPGDDPATAASHHGWGGDYLTLAPGANFPLISDMRDNKCWLSINISKTQRLSPELTLLAVWSWPRLLEVRTGTSSPLTEAEDLPDSGLPGGVARPVLPAVLLTV